MTSINNELNEKVCLYKFNFNDYSILINNSYNINNYGIMRTGEHTYSGVIPLSSIQNNELITIRVTITWDDLPAFNDSDTELGLVEGNVLVFPINFHAKQYLNDSMLIYCNPGYGATGATSCSRCSNNYFSTGGRNTCASCPTGTCSNAERSSCSADFC